MIIIQEIILYKVDRHENGEKVLDFGYILKVEIIGLGSGLHLRYEKEKNQVLLDEFWSKQL